MPGDSTARGRRLRDRVPVRLRHHWKPAGALCAGLALMVYAFGDARVSPYVTSASRVEADTITEDVAGTVGLYDTSVRHSIQLEYDQTDFDKMMKEFKDDGTKESIQADLTVDGVFLQDVGIRLKGNSTLMSLRGTGGMPGGGGRGPGEAGETGQGGPRMPQGAGGPPDGGQGADAGGTAPAGPGPTGGVDDSGGTGGAGAGQGPGGAAGGGRGGGMTQYDLSADKPEELPWLIKIDEYVEGRAYQGEREISLRPGSNAEVPFNEALALSLMKESGEPAERYGFSTLKVNDRPAAARLMVENPDTEYAEAVEGESVVYKARAGGSFAYQGDDPSDYEASFRQLNKVGSQDLEPVMKLIKWVKEASDEEFAEDLGKHLDVESFATYVAAQNLLMNFDDMAGPGKNYLLGYDLDTKKFSVLGWDYNLTFSGDATAGPDDEMSMGGGPGGGRPGEMPEGIPEGVPEGVPEGMPEGFPEGMPGGADGGEGRGGGPGGMSGHALKDRFLELDAFDEVYKTAYRDLYEAFYASGKATEALKDISEQAVRTGIPSQDVSTAVDALRTTVTERTTALAKDEEVTG
ncbi:MULTISPECIES: CotH kinase family protein [unclassified Streptomyces]|uniref:CotH kinase family protein n=1 Tax=unclassified Streptomyces TaxID=2593676 RepID=UPI000805A28D|nr:MULTISPECIES: CotH kinase family protein [unclassified Streptomyces]MYR71892.1 spore coat protein CotH [Streptomyces sp. SID4925]SBU92389.1 Spore coat protein CotH [Streptomyces sp. OspMP-M45]